VPFVHRVDPSLLEVEFPVRLARLGSRYDGGYVVAVETITAARHLLSFGVSMNWDFERDAARLNPTMTVEAYDHSVSSRHFAAIAMRSGISAPLRLLTADVRGAASSFQRARAAVDYFRFFRGRASHTSKRVWYNADRGSMPIADIIARLHSERARPVFAKIDIEGSEYRILPWIIESADLFTGLVIEFHDTDICADLFNRQLRALRRSFRVVHVHGNNYGDLSIDGSLPLSLEITLVHRHFEVLRDDIATRETLDMPNDPGRPDYRLPRRSIDEASQAGDD
jgi:hypothetical protein